MTTTRINPGSYDFTRADGVDFQIERDAHGLWTLYQVLPVTGRREYCQDFTTKRAAVAAALRVEVAA
jgi:hypothetical protein